MATHRTALVWVTFSLAALLYSMAWAQQQTPDGPSIPTKYCSPVNTADLDVGPFYYDWQSDGRCYGNCTDLKYALAIVQDKYCWCSNLIPNRDDQKSTSECQAKCPGYPTDYCGGDGLFGYLEAGGGMPSGTAPAGGSPTGSSSSIDGSDGGSKSPDMTTITVGGIVKTVTAAPGPARTNDAALVQQEGSGLKSGAIAGIVIGVVGGLGIIAAFVWMWFVKRRRQNEGGGNGLGSPIPGGSSPGMTGTPGTGEVSENRFAGGVMAGSAAAAAWDSQNKRRSHLMPVDPRLDPFATGIYATDQNRSRESFSSLQDNQDYSRRVHNAPRVLRATNPDPDDD